MNIEKTNISGVFVVSPKVYGDNRGFFMETYRRDLFAESGISDLFVQDNHSFSAQKNTVRGLNFQFKLPMAKIMRVTRGAAFLVAVDLRKNSPTLGQWFGLEVSAENKKQLYAPAGFARGFQTLTNDVEVQYKCSEYHNDEGEGAILWNDLDVNIDWPVKEEPILSERNRQAQTLKEWLSRPESENFKF